MSELDKQSDLEDHLQHLTSFFKNYNTEKQQRTMLSNLNKIVSEELDNLKKFQQKVFTDNKAKLENTNLGPLYLKAKEKNQELEQVIAKLREENEHLKVNFLIEKRAIEGQYKRQLEAVKSTEKELFAELQLNQASSAIELDETEKRLHKEIDQFKVQLKNERETCDLLKREIFACKRRMSEEVNGANTQIRELKSKLASMGNQLDVAQEKLMERVKTFNVTETQQCSISYTSKYFPLNVVNNTFGTNKNSKKKTLTTTGIAVLKEAVNKKRKLFDPNRFAYEDDDQL